MRGMRLFAPYTYVDFGSWTWRIEVLESDIRSRGTYALNDITRRSTFYTSDALASPYFSTTTYTPKITSELSFLPLYYTLTYIFSNIPLTNDTDI